MLNDKPSLTVRPAISDDIPLLIHLLGMFDAQSLTHEQVTKRLAAIQSLETPFLAISNGEVVGLACLRLAATLTADAPQAELTELFVEKAFRENGIEGALLEQAEALAIQRGARQVTLHTGPRNDEAQVLYRWLGYRDYALAMRKLLPIRS